MLGDFTATEPLRGELSNVPSGNFKYEFSKTVLSPFLYIEKITCNIYFIDTCLVFEDLQLTDMNEIY